MKKVKDSNLVPGRYYTRIGCKTIFQYIGIHYSEESRFIDAFRRIKPDSSEFFFDDSDGTTPFVHRVYGENWEERSMIKFGRK